MVVRARRLLAASSPTAPITGREGENWNRLDTTTIPALVGMVVRARRFLAVSSPTVPITGQEGEDWDRQPAARRFLAASSPTAPITGWEGEYWDRLDSQLHAYYWLQTPQPCLLLAGRGRNFNLVECQSNHKK